MGNRVVSGGDIVPVLTSGDADGADAVVLRRRPDGRVEVVRARWDGSWALGETSPSIAVDDLTGGTLRVLLSRRDHEIVVWLGGHEVLRARGELRPIRPGDLRIGSLPRGGGSGADPTADD